MTRRSSKPFEVTWAPEAKGFEIAQRRGRKDPEVDSLFDFVEEHEFTEAEQFATLDEAFVFAKTKVEEDVSGEVRIARYCLVREHGVDSETEDAVWHVYGDTEGLDIDAPSYRPDSED